MFKEKSSLHDGINIIAQEKKMSESVRKFHNIYKIIPGAPLYRMEFGFYCLEEWREQGLPENKIPQELPEMFMYDEKAVYTLGRLGGTRCDFFPAFEEKLIEPRGECEVRQDSAGRYVLYFKGRQTGFMPEYLDHPVKDMKTWEENVKWRLDPSNEERFYGLEQNMAEAKEKASRGLFIRQYIIGAYMFLRSLIGPEKVLYAFYDSPELVHDCMKTWLSLGKAVTARHQQHLTLDEIYFDEDICYKNGSLISPDMIKEFLFPYYQDLISTIKAQQIDKKRHLYIHVDSDGKVEGIIPLYMNGIGMDVMEPFEVASANDVTVLGKKYPNLIISGGIDKRILASSKSDITRHLEYIIPTMRERGGYIPTCDHGVPAEVSLENYLHYRKLCVELGG